MNTAKYLISWLQTAIMALGGVVAWVALIGNLDVEGVSQTGIFILGACAGALLISAWYSAWILMVPVIKWIKGRIKKQPYSFLERLRGLDD